MSGVSTPLTHADILAAHDGLSGMTLEERYPATSGVCSMMVTLMSELGWELVEHIEGQMIFEPATKPPPIPRDEEFEAWRKRTAGVLEECARQRR